MQKSNGPFGNRTRALANYYQVHCAIGKSSQSHFEPIGEGEMVRI